MKDYDTLNDNEKRNMLASVANLYYNAEMTQNQIAERFFTSRSKISRMLKEARRLGIVEIKIKEPWERDTDIEQQFMEEFLLRDVRVIPTKETTGTLVLQKLGEVAAYYLDNLLDEHTILGMSWGNTMYHTVKAVKTSKNIPITVVPIMGAANVRKPERDSLDLARHADIILTSVGSIEYKSWKDYLSTTDMKNLEKKGAVGHIGGHFYDQDGNEVKTPFVGKMIGLGIQDIKKTKNVICVAGLEMKAEAILGAIRGGYIKTLITDESAAKKILLLNRES